LVSSPHAFQSDFASVQGRIDFKCRSSTHAQPNKTFGNSEFQLEGQE
jgi:hypothetical protein